MRYIKIKKQRNDFTQERSELWTHYVERLCAVEKKPQQTLVATQIYSTILYLFKDETRVTLKNRIL